MRLNASRVAKGAPIGAPFAFETFREIYLDRLEPGGVGGVILLLVRSTGTYQPEQRAVQQPARKLLENRRKSGENRG